MRQRRPKDLEEKLKAHEEYMVKNPEDLKGKWRSVFNIPGSADKKLFLEIGCGKGKFINELAQNNRDNLFLGFEGQDTVILRALEKAKKDELKNLMLCNHYINDFRQIFDQNELNGIYLNFSDPWPKDRHEKRRLTSPRYLHGYAASLVTGGFIRVKTDNVSLFEYSMTQFENHNGFDIIEVSDDLHQSQYNVGNIMTEYERKFSNFKRKINYICVEKK